MQHLAASGGMDVATEEVDQHPRTIREDCRSRAHMQQVPRMGSNVQ